VHASGATDQRRDSSRSTSDDDTRTPSRSARRLGGTGALHTPQAGTSNRDTVLDVALTATVYTFDIN
jgi:hypothetical protein